VENFAVNISPKIIHIIGAKIAQFSDGIQDGSFPADKAELHPVLRSVVELYLLSPHTYYEVSFIKQRDGFTLLLISRSLYK
jgi:hypothetical protein